MPTENSTPTATEYTHLQEDAASAADAIRFALQRNGYAASMYTALRQGYARDIVRCAVATVSGDDVAASHASGDAHRAERAARSLLIGFGVQAQYSPDAASQAAYSITDADFTADNLLIPPTSEPRRVYVAETPCADEYTARIAPDRVLCETGSRTAYLFSEADARLFEGRTGQRLTSI